MIKHIKIAGIYSNWTEEYANIYKEKLCEHGFESKVIMHEKKFYVAYSHRIFSKKEINKLIIKLFGEQDENNK